MYAGIPAICGIVLPFFLWEIGVLISAALEGVRITKTSSSIRQKRHSHSSSDSRLALLGIIALYILLHSFSEHKEFRFLLPILPLVCILAGHSIDHLAQVLETNTTTGSTSHLSIANENIASETKIGNVALPISPRSLLLAALVVLNYPHLLYLSLIHQRGPIAVNSYVASMVNKRALGEKNEDTQQYSVHYLMGCHSAPVYSHLHAIGAAVETWHLDCSPECRSNSSLVCESDAFSKDPLRFVKSTYGISDPGGDGDDSCMLADSVKEAPSFLVVMQEYAAVIDHILTEKLKMSHAGSIQHTVKSLSFHRKNHHDTTISHQCLSNEASCHDVFNLLSLIDVHFDHIEVYKRI